MSQDTWVDFEIDTSSSDDDNNNDNGKKEEQKKADEAIMHHQIIEEKKDFIKQSKMLHASKLHEITTKKIVQRKKIEFAKRPIYNEPRNSYGKPIDLVVNAVVANVKITGKLYKYSIRVNYFQSQTEIYIVL